jgi:hypothetical protein
LFQFPADPFQPLFQVAVNARTVLLGTTEATARTQPTKATTTEGTGTAETSALAKRPKTAEPAETTATAKCARPTKAMTAEPAVEATMTKTSTMMAVPKATMGRAKASRLPGTQGIGTVVHAPAPTRGCWSLVPTRCHARPSVITARCHARPPLLSLRFPFAQSALQFPNLGVGSV